MGENPLSLLAIACSVGALACSLVVMLRSTPQQVRKTAYAAAEIAEEAQAVVRAAANRMITFQDEITREREAARADLDEAERKRRQAAAKLSKVDKVNPQDPQAPTNLAEALAQYDQGDPRRLKLLRQAKTAMGDA